MWSSPFPEPLWHPELLSHLCQWGIVLFCLCQGQILCQLKWAHNHLVQLGSTDLFTGAIFHSLQISNHINQLDPREKLFLKAHIWWCHSSEKITVPQFVVVGRKSCLQQCFGHFYLSVAMDEWKEQISPCFCLPGKNKDVDKRLSWLNIHLLLEVNQYWTSCLDGWKSKKDQRAGDSHRFPSCSVSQPFSSLAACEKETHWQISWKTT